MHTSLNLYSLLPSILSSKPASRFNTLHFIVCTSLHQTTLILLFHLTVISDYKLFPAFISQVHTTQFILCRLPTHIKLVQHSDKVWYLSPAFEDYWPTDACVELPSLFGLAMQGFQAGAPHGSVVARVEWLKLLVQLLPLASVACTQ